MNLFVAQGCKESHKERYSQWNDIFSLKWS